MNITAYQLAERFIGTKEVAGQIHNPQIMAMLTLDQKWPEGDEVPWCSAFVNYICWLLRLPRSKSLRARSWLDVGTPVSLQSAEQGWDVVVLDRPPSPKYGHVGFFCVADFKDIYDMVYLLGGNQSNQVSLVPYPIERVIGVRRLWHE